MQGNFLNGRGDLCVLVRSRRPIGDFHKVMGESIEYIRKKLCTGGLSSVTIADR